MSLAGFEYVIFALDARALLLHNYDKPSRIFSCIFLIRNHMISSAIWKQYVLLNFFKDHKLHTSYGLVQFC